MTTTRMRAGTKMIGAAGTSGRTTSIKARPFKPKGMTMRMVSFAALLFAVFASTSHAQEDGWYLVTTSLDDNNTFSIKLGSAARSQNKQGEPVTVVVGKNSDAKSGTVDIFKWYVTDSDCAQEYGKIVALDVDGTFKFDAAFAKGSKSIGSQIAEIICHLTADQEKKAAGKGI